MNIGCFEIVSNFEFQLPTYQLIFCLKLKLTLFVTGIKLEFKVDYSVLSCLCSMHDLDFLGRHRIWILTTMNPDFLEFEFLTPEHICCKNLQKFSSIRNKNKWLKSWHSIRDTNVFWFDFFDKIPKFNFSRCFSFETDVKRWNTQG